MTYLLDNNVLSESVHARPEPRVLDWLASVPDESLFLSVLSLGEIRKGIEKLGETRRREKLRVWLEHELPDWFGPRILPVDKDVAYRWGRLAADVMRPLPTIDSLLAATAIHHDLRIVTRNVKDFNLPGLEVINPWG